MVIAGLETMYMDNDIDTDMGIGRGIAQTPEEQDYCMKEAPRRYVDQRLTQAISQLRQITL
jgi:hypothetical protein